MLSLHIKLGFSVAHSDDSELDTYTTPDRNMYNTIKDLHDERHPNRNNYAYCSTEVDLGHKGYGYLSEITNFLEREFSKKHNLTGTETSEFINHLSTTLSTFTIKHNVGQSTKNKNISFTEDDKKQLDEALCKKLTEFKIIYSERKNKVKKIIRNVAIGTAVITSASVLYNTTNTEKPTDVDQVHSVKAENQKNYPLELEKLDLQDISNLEKIRKTLGENLKKDADGKEYFEAFGNEIYLDDTKKLQKALATIKAGVDVGKSK